MHTLPDLPYSYDSLEPYIDSLTMEIHHSKHHAAYINNLNTALAHYPELQNKSADELLTSIDQLPDDVRTAIRNNAGGHVNHALFWSIMKPQSEIEPTKEIADAITQNFGSLAHCKAAFSEAAITRFGSGWAWLVVNKRKLEIMSTINQDSPLSEGKHPILGLDVWEHAYYLKYQNRRPEYIEAWWNIVNWEQVNTLFLTHI